ncbi:MAG: prepilin-type N-terminal cleavage/methylation domain-containing protein [Candidatus Marinimicrobia bacterium]|nr:prepilin-type N-terminal cleavage/methylation domain-containing protein [Candidatus Neomarinimicrobiota bacterium]
MTSERLSRRRAPGQPGCPVRPVGAAQSGLSLVELLLALAILGLGLAGLITATSRCLAIAGRLETYQTARRLLGEIEALEPLRREAVEAGVASGTFDPPYQTFHWEREIAEVEFLEIVEPLLFHVRYRVTWSERGSESFEEVETYYYAPAQQLEGGTRLEPEATP